MGGMVGNRFELERPSAFKVEAVSGIAIMLDTVRASPTLDNLTPREREVAWAVARGLSNRQLARELNITLGTVKNYLVHIYEKTRARNRTVLALWVLKHGMTARTVRRETISGPA